MIKSIVTSDIAATGVGDRGHESSTKPTRNATAATCKKVVTGTKKEFGMCSKTGNLVPGIVMLVPRPTSSASLLTPAIQTTPLAAH
jgi:hypothetical protein